MREVSTDDQEDDDSSDVSGYHSDSDSAVMASGNSPFVPKSARYNFLTRSGNSTLFPSATLQFGAHLFLSAVLWAGVSSAALLAVSLTEKKPTTIAVVIMMMMIGRREKSAHRAPVINFQPPNHHEPRSRLEVMVHLVSQLETRLLAATAEFSRVGAGWQPHSRRRFTV